MIDTQNYDNLTPLELVLQTHDKKQVVDFVTKLGKGNYNTKSFKDHLEAIDFFVIAEERELVVNSTNQKLSKSFKPLT